MLQDNGFQPRSCVPIIPASPTNSSPDPSAPPPTLRPWPWAWNRCRIVRRCQQGCIPLPRRHQLAPDPETGGMVMGAPRKPRLREPALKDAAGRVRQPFIELSPLRGGLCADPPGPERGPPTGGGQCRPVTRKESCNGSKGARQLLARATWVPPLLPTHPGLQEQERNGWWESVLLHLR